MCELWNDIKQRFNKRSILLQSFGIELTTAVSFMKSLDQFVSECREKFDSYDVKLLIAVETNLINLKANHAEH